MKNQKNIHLYYYGAVVLILIVAGFVIQMRPIVVDAATNVASGSFVQRDFAGIQSSQVVNIQWGGSEEFHNYLSLDNLAESTVGGLKCFARVNSDVDGYVNSSIFYLGDYLAKNTTSYSSNSEVRSADSLGAISSASWQPMSAAAVCNGSYIQFRRKVTVCGSQDASSSYLIYRLNSLFQGKVLDSVGSAVSGASVCLGSVCNTSSDGNGMGGYSANDVGKYYLATPYSVLGSMTLNVTKSGYASSSINVKSTISDLQNKTCASAMSGTPIEQNITIKSNSTSSNVQNGNGQSTSRSSTALSTSPTSATTTANETVATSTIINQVKLNDSDYVEANVPTFQSGEKIVLSGKTTANAKVTFYLYSDPKTAETIANADGNWTYAIENLESGDHRVEAEVTDPITNIKSERSIIAKFSVANATDTSTMGRVKNKPFLYIGIGIILLALLGGAGYWIWRRRKQNALSSTINN